ncbi:testis-specific protein TEX28 [Orycteropus afer afer]|uniref:Testis-specific protein TEX28 n=1 Tax=Orycteropus afer afer TaxID=1230840 RepID=A0A8B7B9C1_ORYAF|nr:testis-specific protein TEX28 [Orycteropus afer afer]
MRKVLCMRMRMRPFTYLFLLLLSSSPPHGEEVSRGGDKKVLRAEEDLKSQGTMLPSNTASCRSMPSSKGGPSGHSSLSNMEPGQSVQESIRHRILCLTEQLQVEKASRDEYIVGYLKLVSKANRHQALHIRQAFEKLNQRASATIAQIERRLHQYHRQLQELEGACRPKSSMLKAKHSLDSCEQPSSQKALVLETPRSGEEDSLATKLSEVTPGKFLETKLEVQQGDLLVHMKEELTEVKKLYLSLQASCEGLKQKSQADLQLSLEALQEKKCRQQLVEEQVNEQLQEYLDEIYHLKHNLACTEEKMAYLSYERAKEIWEVMETLKIQIAKLETLQQVAQLEMVDKLRSRPQEFLFKFISLLLTLATILLVFISSAFACPWPLVKTRLRTCTSLVLIGLGALAWQKWHAISTTDWQAWVTSKWRLYAKDPKPLSEGM